MQKIFAGLRDAYLHANNKTARDVLVRLSDWAIAYKKNLVDEQFQSMLKAEHGGMNEVLGDVYVSQERRGSCRWPNDSHIVHCSTHFRVNKTLSTIFMELRSGSLQISPLAKSLTLMVG